MDKLTAMKEAGRINKAAILYGLEIAKPGMTKIQLNNKIEQYIRERGMEPAFLGYMGFPATACLCLNEQVVHGIPDNTEIKDGDLLTIDLGIKFNGWNVDAAETRKIIANSAPQQTDLTRIAFRILNNMLNVIKSGISLYDIAAEGDIEAIKSGVKTYNGFGGHGIGAHLHEEPFILHTLRGIPDNVKEQYKEMFLSEGQTICIEPIITFSNPTAHVAEDGWTWISDDGQNSAHIEKTILITRNGCEILS